MKLFTILLTLLLALPLSACVVDDEEFDAAKRQRDEYHARLRDLYAANDQLNQEIAALYAESKALSDRLALVAATRVQLEYTTDLLAAPVRQRQRPRGSN